MLGAKSHSYVQLQGKALAQLQDGPILYQCKVY